MKITAELVSRGGTGAAYRDIEIGIDASDGDQRLLRDAGIPVPNGSDGQRTRDLLKYLWASHGDLYRELAVKNFRTFQPDRNYFDHSSSGWQKFVQYLVGQTDREDVLNRLVQLIGAKIKLFVHGLNPVFYEIKVAEPGGVPVPVNLTKLENQTMEIRIGDQIFQAQKIEQDTDAKKLIEKTRADIESNAAGKIKAFQDECAHNLALMKKQYDEEIGALERKYKTAVIAPILSEDVIRAGVQYTCKPERKEHWFYIPIKLHYKYMRGHSDDIRWVLHKKYQYEQEGVLVLVTDPKYNVKLGHLYDTKLRNTLALWNMSEGICWGSYEPKMKTPADVVGIRNDIQFIMETINTGSLGTRNLDHHPVMNDLRNKIRTAPDKRLAIGLSGSDYHLVADLVGEKKKTTKTVTDKKTGKKVTKTTTARTVTQDDIWEA